MPAIQRFPLDPNDEPVAPAWWRVPMVWLIIGGPLTVVVASLITAVIAVRSADPVLTAQERGGASERSSAPDAMTPALQARNHAATAKQ
jgi:uncharacterized protein